MKIHYKEYGSSAIIYYGDKSIGVAYIDSDEQQWRFDYKTNMETMLDDWRRRSEYADTLDKLVDILSDEFHARRIEK